VFCGIVDAPSSIRLLVLCLLFLLVITWHYALAFCRRVLCRLKLLPLLLATDVVEFDEHFLHFSLTKCELHQTSLLGRV
jgi:hypothetical protein